MSNPIVRGIIRSKNRTEIQYPFKEGIESPNSFNMEELLTFSFSYVEQKDDILEYIIVNPLILKAIVKNVNDFYFIVDKFFIGVLWTAKVILSNDLYSDQILISNRDYSLVLNLNLNKI